MTFRAILLLAVGLTACGPTDHTPDAGSDGGVDAGPLADASAMADASDDAGDSGYPASCTCGPRPDLGVPSAEPCGSTICYQGKVWSCGVSGWTDEIDAGACSSP